MSNDNSIRTAQILSFRGKKDKGYEFVAATENPIRTWDGPEWLLIDGMDTQRFEANPVILDSHSRNTIEDIIGKAVTITKEDRALSTTIDFAATTKGKTAEYLVENGFVRALSVGFNTREKVRLREGETYSKRSDIKGPGVVVSKSELMEISLLSIPADSGALKRAYTRSIQTEHVTKLVGSRFEKMANKLGVDVTVLRSIVSGEVPPTEEIITAISEFLTIDRNAVFQKIEDQMTTANPQPVTTSAVIPAVPATPAIETRTVDVVTEIRRIAPRGMETLADKLVLEGKTVEQARAAFLEKLTVTDTRAGHVEPGNSPSPAKAPISEDGLLAALSF